MIDNTVDGSKGKVSNKWHVLAPVIAILGGSISIVTAIVEEGHYGGYFGIYVAAPILEELMKPIGVYFLLAKWPHALRGRLYTATLSALAGLTFSIIENILYLFVYFPDHSQSTMIWRYAVCIPMHVICSFILGFGINSQLVSWVKKEVTFLKGNRTYFLAAILIHSGFNILVINLTE